MNITLVLDFLLAYGVFVMVSQTEAAPVIESAVANGKNLGPWAVLAAD